MYNAFDSGNEYLHSDPYDPGRHPTMHLPDVRSQISLIQLRLHLDVQSEPNNP